MRAEHMDAFVSSAFEVLGKQAEGRPERGSPVLRSGETRSSRELTALVAFTGDLEGVTFYSMSLATAGKLASVMQRNGAPDASIVDSDAMIEMARLIAAASVIALDQEGCHCQPADPVLVKGFGEPLTLVSPVLVVPLFTEYGDIDIGIALKQAASGKSAQLAEEAA